MQDTPRLTFPAFFAETLSRFGHHNALALVGQKPATYAEVDRQIKATIAFLETLEVKPGDKVAILGANQPNWAVAYFAVTFMGAVVVPLLPEFLPSEISSLLVHSETRVVFVSENLTHKLTGLDDEILPVIIKLEDYALLRMQNAKSKVQSANPASSIQYPVSSIQYPTYLPTASPQHAYSVNEDDLAAIIYTSGTTGTPKGVMLTHKNICFSAITGYKIQNIVETDRFLSILPLSHTYENTLGLILPMYRGACVYYLGKPPTPNILLPALQAVKPTTILTVPLIIEKIFRSKILPAFTEKKAVSLLYKIPVVRKLLHRIAGKKLMETFGGEVRFFGVGGAKLNKTVEKFLIESRFPYAVGYGLTECSPLLAGFNPQHPVLQSTGPACVGVELRIMNTNPRTGEGEIWAKGDNIMQGYYKEPAITNEILTPDGWLKTGDLGSFDSKGNLSIKGRVKSMIVRSNGENVYPEDIESVINNFRHVVDSLVIEKKGKLVALVHFNQEEIEQRYMHLKTDVSNYVDQKIEELRHELQEYVNARVNKFSQVQMVVYQPVPFDKTATQKIKRFMYI